MRKATNILGIIQAFVALGAIPAGLSVIVDPSGSGLGAPLELLQYSPFQSFLIPGLFLFIGNGVLNVIGAWSSFTKKPYAAKLGFWLGLFLIAWIVIQVYFIRSIHYIHLMYLGIGIVETIVAYSIKSNFSTIGKVKRTDKPPTESLILHKFDDYHYCDSFSVINQTDDTIDKITTTIFQTPRWADTLMKIRNTLFSPTGLDKGGYKKDTYVSDYYPVGSRAVYFTVINRNDNEIVTAENDKHLDFRISVLKSQQGKDANIHLTTLVKYHNFLGRFYFTLIKPFHRTIVISLLKKLLKKNISPTEK